MRAKLPAFLINRFTNLTNDGFVESMVTPAFGSEASGSDEQESVTSRCAQFALLASRDAAATPATTSCSK
jgi:hypothetical protein